MRNRGGHAPGTHVTTMHPQEPGPPAPAPDRLRGGELNAAVTSALVGIHTRYVGRGPERAQTFHHGNVVVTLMHGVMTRAEHELTARRRGDAVAAMRTLTQGLMGDDFRGVVEQLTGRGVVSYVSGHSSEDDLASGIFILDGPL